MGLSNIASLDIVAAAASSLEIQESVINTTHTFLTNRINDVPFGTKYNVIGSEAGKWVGNEARSTVGSHLALLTLRQGTWTFANTTIASSYSDITSIV